MINALFAVDKFGGMGLNGTLPWPHHPEDMAYFQKLTTGHIVVMGRNTWEDPKMPKPLKGRDVYVVTSKPIDQSAVKGTLNGSMSQCLAELEKAHPNKIIWVIGGPALLAQCDGTLDKLYLTHHKNSYKIDSKIDLKSFLSGWTPHTATAAPYTNCSFVTYVPIFRRVKTNPWSR